MALIVAFGITFPLSIVRLAIMALVVNNPIDFEYWHGTDGSNIFMTASLIGFGAFILINASDDFTIAGSSPPSINSKNNPPSWLVVLATAISMLFFIVAILLPQGGAKTFASSPLPQNIDLSGWHLKHSEPLSLAEIGQAMPNDDENQVEPSVTAQDLSAYQENQVESNTLLAGQRYFYGNGTTTLTSTLRYVVNADGQFPGIQNPNFSEFDANALKQKNNNLIGHQDKFLLFTDNAKTHLISCITPRGQSVTNPTSLILSDRIRHTLSDPLKLYQWLKGERLLWDRRCLWVHLSSPTDSANVNPSLEKAWEQLLQYWRSHFPAF